MSPSSSTRATTIIICAIALPLLGCSGSEHGNPDRDTRDSGADDGGPPDFGNGPIADMVGGKCRHDVWPSPEEPRVQNHCHITGGEGESGPTQWTCECGDRTLTRAYDPDVEPAKQCAQALTEHCQVDLDERTFCTPDSGGLCWPDPSRDDGFLCVCGEASEAASLAGELTAVRASSCEAAAFAHCARECEDRTGHCAPTDALDRFECSCGYLDATRDTPAARCEQALRGCNPELQDGRDDAGLSCSGFAGYCDELDGELRCVCADDTAHARPIDALEEATAEGCSSALFELCGNGLAEREAFSCWLDKEERRHCIASFDFASGRYPCRCESQNECNAEYDLRESTHDAADCDGALSACSAADDEEPREPAPECVDDPDPRSCSTTDGGGRSCVAAWQRDGLYRCECYTDDGQTEVDIWNGEAEAERCDAALTLCQEMDAH